MVCPHSHHFLISFFVFQLAADVSFSCRTGVLLPRELILFASPVLDRGGFLNKQRTLILTDYPRLICIKETPTKVTLKSEVFLGVKPSSKAGAATFIKAEAETDRVFTVKTVRFASLFPRGI